MHAFRASYLASEGAHVVVFHAHTPLFFVPTQAITGCLVRGLAARLALLLRCLPLQVVKHSVAQRALLRQPLLTASFPGRRTASGPTVATQATIAILRLLQYCAAAALTSLAMSLTGWQSRNARRVASVIIALAM